MKDYMEHMEYRDYPDYSKFPIQSDGTKLGWEKWWKKWRKKKYVVLRVLTINNIIKAGDKDCKEFAQEFGRFMCSEYFKLLPSSDPKMINDLCQKEPRWVEWLVEHKFICEKGSGIVIVKEKKENIQFSYTNGGSSTLCGENWRIDINSDGQLEISLGAGTYAILRCEEGGE